jgi:hypothetical protein
MSSVVADDLTRVSGKKIPCPPTPRKNGSYLNVRILASFSLIFGKAELALHTLHDGL